EDPERPVYNAFCFGRRSVAVAWSLVCLLAPDELAGIFAHEVGHAVTGGTDKVRALLGASAGLSFFHAFFRGMARWGWIVFLSGGLIVLIWIPVYVICIAAYLALVPVYWLALAGVRVVVRRGELEADEYAVRAGLGCELARALRRLPGQRAPLLLDFWSTHPPLEKRLRRLEAGFPKVVA
ncbi:MAG TPA: hypothetical protein EYP63_02820, partial [Desulfotomaculum sp.]|nr:hypothetical protein [Desulfotomaculum sp.]